MLKNKFKKIVSIAAALLITTNFYSYGQDYSNVFRKAREGNPNFGNSKIYDIAMLGSHDALSDKIDKNSRNDYRTNMPDLCGLEDLGLVKQVSANYARAQSETLSAQLQAGVRYIDARITRVDGVYYTMHSLLSGKLEDYLKELLMFLVNNPGEFVVFDIAACSTYEANENALAEYMAGVKVSANNREYNIYDFINYDTSKDFSEITYNDVTKEGKSAGLIIVSNLFQSSPTAKNKVTNNSLRDFFKYKSKYAHWYNDASSSSLISKIDDLAREYEEKGYVGFKCNQVQTTPNGKSIAQELASGSLIKSAQKHNVAVLESPHFDYWLSVMPIMWFDDVTSKYGDFNSRINEKLLNYNLNLNNTADSKIKLKRLTDSSQLADHLKILIRTPYTANGFFGSGLKCKSTGSYKANKFVVGDDVKGFWTLIKSGSGWRIMLPDDSYLKRISGNLKTTTTKSSSTTFKIDISDNGIAKIVEPANIKRNVYLNGDKLDLSISKSSKFEIYEVK